MNYAAQQQINKIWITSIIKNKITKIYEHFSRGGGLVRILGLKFNAVEFGYK